MSSIAQQLGAAIKTAPAAPRPKHGIIRSYVKDGRRYELHATKGWRSRRV